MTRFLIALLAFAALYASTQAEARQSVDVVPQQTGAASAGITVYITPLPLED